MEKNKSKNINKNLNLKFIYTWLSQINEMSYMLYIRLLRVFSSVQNLYILSKDKNKFKNILIQNNIILSENLINQLTSFSQKENSLKIYNNLIKQNIDIIHIEDFRFPKSKFSNMYNQPICLYVYGNINKLKDKAIYLHKEKFNEYGRNIYEMFSKYISEKKWNNIINVERFENSDVLKKYCCNRIYVVNQDIFDINFKLESFENVSCDNLYILIPIQFNEDIKNKFYLTEIIVSISNICIIPQAKYDKKKYVKNIVELFLEQSKNVLVVPGNIYCKYNYFSNYLIKEGAEVILNKHEIDQYL